jgi:gamma-glutamylcyclotransferase (GGCT)/AIG2-like uncharacterized protein YtfP
MSPDRTGVAVNQALQRTLASACASELRAFGNSGVLMNKKYQLAVNGTLMRGLPLNENLVKVGATFRREMKTSDCYRLWSINDRYPRMLRTTPLQTGRSITVEVWELDGEGLAAVLDGEPPGLTIGRVELQDGSSVFGVLAEPYLVEGQREITELGGWRGYMNQSTEHRQDTGCGQSGVRISNC